MIRYISERLWIKFFLLLLLIGLLPLGVASLFFILISQNAFLERQRLEIEREASEAAMTLEAMLEKTRSDLLLVARDPSFARYLEESPGSKALRVELQESLYDLQTLSPGPLYQAAFVRADGTEISRIVSGRVSEPGVLGTNGAVHRFLNEEPELRPGWVYQQRPRVKGQGGGLVLPLLTPVYGSGPVPAGLILLELDLEYMRRQLQGRMRHGNTLFVVDGRGELVFNTEAPPDYAAVFAPDMGAKGAAELRRVIRKMAGGREGFERLSLEGGDRYLTYRAMRPVAHLSDRWTVAAMTPAQGMDVGRDILVSSGILFLATLIGIVLLSYWIGRAVTHPIKKIVAVTDGVAQGDLNQEIRFESKDELGRLAESFNEMIKGLRQREEYLSLNRELNELVITDGLTGLYNHRYFQDRLAEEMERSARTGSPFALLFSDLDYFKAFNDLNGHHLGDIALKSVADIIRQSKRGMDVAARYGGEEFALVLPGTEGAEAVRVAERLRREVEAFSFESRVPEQVRLTISIGIAVYPKDAGTKEELIERADLMMYYAKVLGRNQVHLYEQERGAGSLVGRDHLLRDSMIMSALQFMTSMVDEKDHYTHRHSEVVTGYAVATARQMGLSRNEIYHIGLAALLHDVGKISVSDEILSKQGPLSAKEMASIKAYPLIGAEILKRNTNFKHVLPMVLHHRERFDGGGYPAQLSGAMIPLGARIIAVADAYYAMLTERPYRPAMSREEAIRELRRSAGSQFDPYIVEAFVQALQSGAGTASMKDISSFLTSDR